MRSFILASKDINRGLEYVFEIFQKKIDKLDITVESFEKSVGIEDVRNLQKKLFYKPLRGDTKVFAINAENGITIESQNALLKILEEPPLSTFMFLIVKNTNILLPTILSRCKIIKLGGEKDDISEKEISEFEKLIGKLSSRDINFKLKLAQDRGEDREEAILWFEKAIFAARKILFNKLNSQSTEDLEKTLKIIKKLEEGHYFTQNTNVNPRFILENTLLSI